MTRPEGIEARLRKPGVAHAIGAGHPWVYRDALARFSAAPGAVVTVRDTQGGFLGRGIADAGPIGVRLWTTRNEPIDEAFVRRRVRDAIALRARTMPPHTDAIRLLHGEDAPACGGGPELPLDGAEILEVPAALFGGVRARAVEPEVVQV